ncbi:DUF1793-domain-containing protein [Fomitiporia mediterranea MF3/22]|uniref:DUF1793-domain-containing protein n=1 Tax=Fomitiporia mediterranea (strain MF3/22) TaxID=694068 RepID=UPI0004408B8D|nr:DUF1793-domain-containing protein [Fomitiporia mediterranea MF3/22]EJD03589.1 DUF1793-domain-containing protein [Fomitiporia mediterranea MF3/22]
MTLAITLFRLLFASLFIDRLFAQDPAWTSSPFSAPALPLAVRSPYLNTWLGQGGNALPLHAFWTKLWRMDIDTGWYSLVVVDGVAYRIMGEMGVPSISPATQTSTEFTATRTSFLFMAGPMRINASFISPIEPTDLVRQSLPYSYFTMSASSTDGKSHSVRMYSDIAGQFIGPSNQLAQWNANATGDYIILSMQLVTPQRYSESSDIAMDSTAYYGFKAISGATTSWAISNDTLNRSNAANANITLGNMTQPAPRSIQDKLGNWTTLGISIDWGEVESTPQPAVWSLGVVRSPSIQYAVPPSMQDRYPYFIATYPDPQQATAAFLNDFPRAQSVAAQFDARISSAGRTISQSYADLLALSARQVMGSLDITISKAADGSWKMWDLMVFMKNMGGFGSDATGPVSSVNAVDTLYAAFPAFMYLNPDLGGYLLTPLMEYQDSSVYTLSYAARNIGSTYPNATADNINSPHTYGIEESAGMLIMTLAYTQWSGNNTLISKHYGLLRGWAEYLGNNTLTPTAQSSADFVLGQALSSSNQTNLALKGIIGIACMAKIAAIAGSNDDQSRFDATASSYITQWQKNSLPSDGSHIDFFYGNSDSSGLIYNLYADRLLQLNLVPQEVYQAVTSFYNTAGDSMKYGLPLNNKQVDRTTTHWMMFAASTATDTTGTFMVSQIHNYASSQQNNTPFAVSYNPSLGNGVSEPNSGKNRYCNILLNSYIIH